MTEKSIANQAPARRAPQQARSLHKVELILEAATQLLDQGDIDALTTNALAKKAGISIGTLYQYFKDKEAVLSALVDQQVAAMSARVLDSLQAPAAALPGDRIRAIVRAVLDAYGGRRRAHRVLMIHGMNRGPSSRLNPMYGKLVQLFTRRGVPGPGQAPVVLSEAEAYVLTHAVAGVLRSLVAEPDQGFLPREDLEDALVRLILGFVADRPESSAAGPATGSAI